MSKSKFYDRIKTAQKERQVEDVYNEGLKYYLKGVKIEYPYECDGFIDAVTCANKYLKLIIEYKYNENLATPADRARVLVQVIYYLRRFEDDGQILPNVVLIGDINECFVLHTNEIADYLDESVDWSIAPSQAADKNPQLVLKIANNQNINPFVFRVDDSFSFKNVVDRICDLADNVQRYVRVTEHNISNIYNYFTDKVILNADKISAHDLVEIFLGTITDKENYFQNPSNPSILMANNRKISIEGSAYKSFFGYFNRDYTMDERHRFAEIADRLIEDTNRRKNGDFFTPTPFVDYAHKMICEQLGEDWKEKFVVWDCCWGTGNLTRDYKFSELYASTLKESELRIGEHYNREATKFQLDFLNDPIEPDLYGTKVPKSLLDALKEDKPIIFFINPPYGTPSSDFGKGDTNSKGQGTCNSTVNREMVTNKMGIASNNLFSQFLYRIIMLKKNYGLKNLYLGLYSPTTFLTSDKWKNFRHLFLSNFKFRDAFQFQASYFSNVSEDWGLSFSVWSDGETANKICFNYRLVDFVGGMLSELGKKDVYNIDGCLTAKVWIKEPIKKVRVVSKPTFSSGIKLVIRQSAKTKIAEKALGCYSNMANNVDQSEMKVSIFSSCDSTNANGLSIMRENFDRVVSIFAARKLIEKTWINNKDEFFAPNEQHEKWQVFVNDSIVFSLFHSSSNQSSLRDIEYKGRKWNIKNEFFFMPKQRIMELADANNFTITYEDARTDSERYVYKLISGQENLASETLANEKLTLSTEAQAVLDKAISLTEKAFPYREIFNQLHPDYQIMNWDCGWYQIKALVGEYFKNDLSEFQQLYKTLSEKMRPMVYELGFLK